MVTSLGSSAEPIGAGSTYLRVVRSVEVLLISAQLREMGDEFRYTLFRVNLLLHVEVDGRNDQVRNNVQRADAHEDLGIVEGYLLGYLHHTEDDHQIGAVGEL